MYHSAWKISSIHDRSCAETELDISTETDPFRMVIFGCFPRRNRLISAWSDELVVISPGKGSGSLITAKYSENYGRKVKIIVQSEVARDFTT